MAQNDRLATTPEDAAAQGYGLTLSPIVYDESTVPYDWSVSVPNQLRGRYVRRACRDFLVLHAASDSGLADAEVVIAELVSNVERHAGGRAIFRIRWRTRYPHVVVLDEGPGFPANVSSTFGDPYAESGRGLALISSLAISVQCGNRASGGGWIHVVLPVDRASYEP